MQLKHAINLKTLLIPSLLSCAAISVNCYADHEPIRQEGVGQYRGIVALGLTFGGDTFTKVKFDNGDNDNIKAGELALFTGGLIYEQDNWQIQGTISYYTDTASGENGDVCFTRIPLEILGFWKQDNFRLGAGLTHHLSPEFEIDIDNSADNGTVEFDDATGLVVQGDYFFSSQFGVGLRYTSVEYENDFSSEKIDGDSVGLIFSYIF